jgi:hypothetical protein
MKRAERETDDSNERSEDKISSASLDFSLNSKLLLLSERIRNIAHVYPSFFQYTFH